MAGRRVFDLASGSGLCAIAALRAGASTVTAADIDVFAAAAIDLNARAAGHRVGVVRRDVLDDDPPDVDVILAGDCGTTRRSPRGSCPGCARRRSGIAVLVGDPGRRYLPVDELVELAAYDVRTSTELEDLDHKEGRAYALRPAGTTRAPAQMMSASPSTTSQIDQAT